jgi:uncharacterized protein YjdB
MENMKKKWELSKCVKGLLLTAIMATTILVMPTNEKQVEAASSVSSPRVTDKNVTYDCVYFGNYPQSDATGEKKDPIKWRVLSVSGNDAFLIADVNLDVAPYNDQYYQLRNLPSGVLNEEQYQKYYNEVAYMSVTWETCTLRSWLNGYGSESNKSGVDCTSDNFIDTAFTSNEQNAIITSTVVNSKNYWTDIWGKNEYNGGNDTKDKIYLLSADEAYNTDYGFPSIYGIDYSAIQRKNTAYVLACGSSRDYIYATTLSIPDELNTFGWWLRTPYTSHGDSDVEGKNLYAAAIATDGYVTSGSMDHIKFAVCPVLHLNLSSSVWSNAGTESFTRNEYKYVEKMSISGTSNKIAAGKTVQLKADITPEDATNKTVTWTSSNTKYATVDKNGKVTLKKKGAGKTVYIYAETTDGSYIRDFYKITIMKDAVKSVKISKAPKSVKAGKTVKLKSTVKTTGKKANKTLNWTSSDTKYATVSKKGVVKTKKAGKGKTVKITAAATDGSNKKAVVKIKLK